MINFKNSLKKNLLNVLFQHLDICDVRDILRPSIVNFNPVLEDIPSCSKTNTKASRSGIPTVSREKRDPEAHKDRVNI